MSGVKIAVTSQVQSVFSQTEEANSNVILDCGKTDNVMNVKVPVRTRVFTNSLYNSKNVTSLLAKGNKVKTLKRMTTCYETSNLRQGECNHVKNEITQEAKPSLGSEKGVKESVTEHTVSISDTSQGVKSIKGKEGGGCSHPVIDQVKTMDIQVESVVSDTPGECGDRNKEKALLYDTNGLDDDKFVNTIFNKGLNEVARRQAELHCHTYRLWKQQSKFDFGFVPLSDFIQVPKHEGLETDIKDPSELHKLIKASGTYNFLGLKIPLHSQLNVDQWEKQLEGYWDNQLLDLIKYGFPMDFNRQSPLRWEGKNHNSALQFPQDVEAYLKEEIQFGAIQGPFT